MEEAPPRLQLALVLELVLPVVLGLQASSLHSLPGLGLVLLCHPTAGSSSTWGSWIAEGEGRQRQIRCWPCGSGDRCSVPDHKHLATSHPQEGAARDAHVMPWVVMIDLDVGS